MTRPSGWTLSGVSYPRRCDRIELMLCYFSFQTRQGVVVGSVDMLVARSLLWPRACCNDNELDLMS